MQIRVGYELIYDCPQLTPMVLMLNIHYTRASDLAVPDLVIANPSVPITGAVGSLRRRASSDFPPVRW